MRLTTIVTILAAACSADEVIGSQAIPGVCTATPERCGPVPDGGAGGGGVAAGGDGGPLGDANYYAYLGPECSLQCPGASSVVADDGFEGGLVGWATGPGGATATIACGGSIDGSCYLETAGSGLALYRATPPLSEGVLLVRAWVRPVAVTDGGGLHLRTALGAEDYVGFVLLDGVLAYPWIDSGAEANVNLTEYPAGEWSCLRAVVNLPDKVQVFWGLGTNVASASIPYVHGVVGAVSTIELSAADGHAVDWDDLLYTQCQ